MDAIAVLGAGVAGLAAGLRLHKKGFRVIVFEKNREVGGKLSELSLGAYRFDMGPSLFTMPQLLEEIFSLYGKRLEDYLPYTKHTESCRYFFGTEPLIFYSDREQLKTELTRHELDANRVEKYLNRSEKHYQTVGEFFLENAIHKPLSLPFFKLLKALPRLMTSAIFTSLDRFNRRRLKSKRLTQIFNRFATYNGSNPYSASAILSMIPHLEQNVGTFFPQGGMRGIIRALSTLAEEEGLKILSNQQIQSCMKKGKKYEIETLNTSFQFDRLVCAIDHLTFYKDVIWDQALFKKYKRQERSSSALIFYWGVNGRHDQLGLHNILFSEDYKNEFREIFKKKQIPVDPTIYIHISSKCKSDDAPSGCENWFVMINVPASDDTIDSEQIEQIRQMIIARINHKLNIELSSQITDEYVWTPEGIANKTGSYMGALYGAAQNKKMSALTRHPNKSEKYEHLYFCGGTVHPGGGIPLSLQSAKIVEKLN